MAENRGDEEVHGGTTIGLVEEMAMESGAMIDKSVVEEARRPFRTGGEVESSQLTALHSRDAFENMADHLAHAADHKDA